MTKKYYCNKVFEHCNHISYGINQAQTHLMNVHPTMKCENCDRTFRMIYKETHNLTQRDMKGREKFSGVIQAIYECPGCSQELKGRKKENTWVSYGRSDEF